MSRVSLWQGQLDWNPVQNTHRHTQGRVPRLLSPEAGLTHTNPYAQRFGAGDGAGRKAAPPGARGEGPSCPATLQPQLPLSVLPRNLSGHLTLFHPPSSCCTAPLPTCSTPYPPRSWSSSPSPPFTGPACAPGQVGVKRREREQTSNVWGRGLV